MQDFSVSSLKMVNQNEDLQYGIFQGWLIEMWHVNKDLIFFPSGVYQECYQIQSSHWDLTCDYPDELK